MVDKKLTDGSMALQDKQCRVITIEATEKPRDIKLRVAAYVRVSSASDDQLNSFAAQNRHYVELISSKENWSLVDIYADEGITGTSADKRADFQRLLADCRRGLIDKILVKSISRFARNTKECLEAIRELKALGIGIYFEKENINTLEADSEILITMLGAFAQAESESISANVRWGKRQAMREGKAHIQYNRLYAYEKGEDDNPKIIPEQAEVVRSIYDQYLTGASLRMIKERLEDAHIINVVGNSTWTITAIRSILTNENYCGDVLLQKTYVSDCISRKVIRNTGQLPMYLVQNHHEGIVDRKTFDAVQTEMARRNAGKSPSKILCQQVRSFRATGLWRMRNPIPSLYLVQAGQKACGMAMCQPPGLRHEVLPPLPYPGRRASPASHPRRHQLCHESKEFPHPANYISHGIGSGSCPWPKYEPCRYRAATHRAE